MYINFGDIPGNHNLFLDYVYEFEHVKDFYKTNFRDKDSFNSKFKKISESTKETRGRLFEILTNQYSELNASAVTKKNLDSLKDQKTLAIVTGQQLGILGGPLYTLYKTITAIKLSNYLNEHYSDYKFVPVFWLEGDDHDFNEVRSLNVINKENELTQLSYDDELVDEDNLGSVGRINIKETISEFFKQLEDTLRPTEFSNDIFEKLRSFYNEGNSIKKAFKEMMFWLFDQYGLVLFDPQDKTVKEALIPVFKKEINDFRTHTSKLVHVSATLEEKYHAQVKVRPINLFYSNDEGRYAVEPSENEFKLKRKRKKFSYEEIMQLIETEPENFSPNVLLRPICQDSILPTAFYIGGPSEISYFAQIMPLYEFYNLEAPFIYPRSSVTIVEKNISKIIDKYSINLTQLFVDQEQLIRKVVESVSENSIEELFGSTSEELEKSFNNLKEKLSEVDKTISDASEKYKDKTLHYLDELKNKSIEAQKRKYETTLRQVEKVVKSLYPNNNLQERELSFIYFANKYGLDILKYIFDEVEINKFEHQILNL